MSCYYSLLYNINNNTICRVPLYLYKENISGVYNNFSNFAECLKPDTNRKSNLVHIICKNIQYIKRGKWGFKVNADILTGVNWIYPGTNSTCDFEFLLKTFIAKEIVFIGGKKFT